jgi:pantoate--beta-alanine ligase
MSSRNVRLSPQDRKAAVILSRALLSAEEICSSKPVSAAFLRRHVRTCLQSEPRAEIQSVDIRHAVTLAPLTGRIIEPAVALLAVRFGDILLIDQHIMNPFHSSLKWKEK